MVKKIKIGLAGLLVMGYQSALGINDCHLLHTFNAMQQLIDIKTSSVDIWQFFYANDSLAKQCIVRPKLSCLYHYRDTRNRLINRTDNSGQWSHYLMTWLPVVWGVGMQSVLYIANRHHSIVGEISTHRAKLNRYSAYGLPLIIKQPSQPLAIHNNPLMYAGYPYTKADHLYYLSTRFYDPVCGIFSSRDSTDLSNRYAYVNNNPTNEVDPSGHKGQFLALPWDVIKGPIVNYLTLHEQRALRRVSTLLAINIDPLPRFNKTAFERFLIRFHVDSMTLPRHIYTDLGWEEGLRPAKFDVYSRDNRTVRVSLKHHSQSGTENSHFDLAFERMHFELEEKSHMCFPCGVTLSISIFY